MDIFTSDITIRQLNVRYTTGFSGAGKVFQRPVSSFAHMPRSWHLGARARRLWNGCRCRALRDVALTPYPLL